MNGEENHSTRTVMVKRQTTHSTVYLALLGGYLVAVVGWWFVRALVGGPGRMALDDLDLGVLMATPVLVTLALYTIWRED